MAVFLPMLSAQAAINNLNGLTGGTQTFANDTNIKITSSGTVHTLGWQNILSLVRGGTNNNSFTVHGLVFAGASKLTQDAGNLFYASSSVRLGIGTNNPSFRLDVQGGQINSSGGLCIAGDCKASWSQIASGSTNFVSKFSGPSSLVKSQIFDSGTNVGIGTTSPAFKLDVNGSVNGTSLCISGNCKTSWPASGIQSLNGLSATNQTFVNDSNITITSSGSAHVLGWSGLLPISRGGTNNSAFTTGSIPFFDGSKLTENNGQLYWDNTNNRLGVGTSTPTSSITSAGTIESTAGGFKFPDGTTQTTAATSSSFGTWQSGFSQSTNYQATTDGFVVVDIDMSGDPHPEISGFTDSSVDPSTRVVHSKSSISGTGSSIIFPVRKNDYWRVEIVNGSSFTVRFIPLGQ